MTKEDIFREIGGIDPQIIIKAAPKQKASGYIFLKCISVAACLCLLCWGITRFAIALIPNQATDHYREGNLFVITNIHELPAKYDGKLLIENIDFEKADLYYDVDGTAENTDDWYSILLSEPTEDYYMTLFCFFGGRQTLEEWKVDMVFTKKATQTTHINGTEVQFARHELSLQYEYWYYAIFEYDGVIYDLRVKSDHADTLFEILYQLIPSY